MLLCTSFPPLIAALSCAGEVPVVSRRTDVDEILRLLLSFGADPNQRGINDHTALHMAVAQRDPLAVQFCSRAAPIPNCVRGSTNVRRRSKWRRRPG